MSDPKPNISTAIKTAALLAAFFILTHYMDGPPDWQAEEDSAASLRDAVAQARSESWAISQK